MSQLRLAIVTLVTISWAANAQALIINIDGVSDTNSNPQEILLTAGTYEFMPVNPSIDAAADYTAWRAFGSTWLWVFNVRSSSGAFSELAFGSPTTYSSAQMAYDNSSTGGSFTVTQDELIWFSIGDSFYGDNSGGVSIDLNLVPEPSTALLLLLGLGAMSRSRMYPRREG